MVDRLSLYYSVANANSSVALREGFHETANGTVLSFRWYGEYFGNVDIDSWPAFLRLHANVEFNNEGGWFSPLVDFGVAGGLIIAAALWLFIGYAWQRGMWRASVGAIACPLAVMCALEMPRFLYFGQSRALPSIVTLLIVLALQPSADRSRS